MSKEQLETNDILIDENDKDSIELEIVDDTPEDDKGKPPIDAGDNSGGGTSEDGYQDDDDEIKQYGKNVQKRIQKLTYDKNQERRAREKVDRELAEAVAYSQKMRDENERLRNTVDQGESVLITQAKSRVAAELLMAKNEYKDAYESGDSDALMEAQSKLSKLENESFRVENYKPRQAPPPQQQPAQQPTVPKPDALALEWGEKNSWFGKDKAMTGYAFGINEQLQLDGVDPRTKEYYDKLDASLRETFPDKFPSVGDDSTQRHAPRKEIGSVVAPTNRGGKKPRKVTLTQSQVRVAKRIGVSLEDYARQIMKDSGNG